MNSLIPLYIVTGLYIVQSAMSIYSGSHAQGMMIGGYVIANIGLIWSYG